MFWRVFSDFKIFLKKIKKTVDFIVKIRYYKRALRRGIEVVITRRS